MKFLRKFLDKQEKHFKEGKLKGLYYLFEAIDTFLYTPGKRTPGASHIRDTIDFKRIMMMVVIALTPAVLIGLYNVGYQANLELAKLGEEAIKAQGWRVSLLNGLGIGLNASNIFACFIHGLLYFLPIYIVTMLVGGFWEVLFACIRRHEVHEGFFVTGLLFPLILPPTIPLWQVAIGISFGVVIGKEIFGGVGMNIFNPALLARAFLFFAYPIQISGNAVWVAVDGVTKATPLAVASEAGTRALTNTVSWWDAFLGIIPGSIGETSTLAILIGAFILVVTGIGSWRIMTSVLVGMVGFSLLFNLIGSSTNPMFGVDPLWHLVLGGFAFGTVFMATDPVSAAITKKGKYAYGLLIGLLVVLVRVINPGYPEGMMLAILFANMFAPLIDRIYINKNIKRRNLRYVK
ncbi:MAG: NADH:ubiquinone reductase (Na(+)-transporting) subunit B [Candidatus Aminicenantes bacterium]|nr:NADH:ubiquinone reductase (Na(+)-transporting) subunit B [Candidatus Aminicenantes bacterium]NIM82968.1 NADH:ubiquinone reductase (Na(+)-transporting) subunit B [Candidatus Aminicenantes bacterium]NIN22353.1 NADH:ubiquinone reductase (Na(+)-transporting) subunit B [Candidatus Aminicenantes bacterium]NIN46113.1 NADH:ubiquinone reductase (Na(+)-transporting) subunit B [Candidatus Aminicenantes bacterium]NIN88949.1 NADH:ubiquinone reductase (Na(+)-transporting) subunit B [Candidatus Aminicenant